MALYCYIIETGYYDDRQANILGHENKYSHKEFDNICIEITKKYGDVEVEYFSNYDLTDVEEIKYNIDAHELIKYLVSDYGFIELNVPVNDGYNIKEISRKPVSHENLRLSKVEIPSCPMDDEKIKFPDSYEDIRRERINRMHFHARCSAAVKHHRNE